MKGNTTVNESISASFDPGKLVCISCGNEHNVIGKNPIVILFSDQNFTATLDCNNGGCIHIVRMENATLLELLGVAKEIFGDVVFPEGSILMFGTVSYLGRCGTSIYARDWTEVVAYESAP
jgi:hypothetical protein